MGLDMIEFCLSVRQDIPYYMPKLTGALTMLICNVDADHASNKVICCSVTSIVILQNNTLMSWVPKQQKTAKTSTYGFNLVAAMLDVNQLLKIRYEL